jgi:probable F420-dependent oxidoreductase
VQHRSQRHRPVVVDGMKFALDASGLSARHYPEVAELAEANGFGSIWIPEHLVMPVEVPPGYSYTPDEYSPMRPETPTFDPFVVLAGVATRTTTIGLGTSVFILPLRHPIAVARSVVTLDRMSGGRFTFGVGVGWLQDEFEIMGEDFHNRGKRTDEMIVLLRKLWSEDVIEFHGDFYDIPPIKFHPKPVNRERGIPIFIGGTSPAALRRAGRLGDGWIHHVQIHASFLDGEPIPAQTEEDFAQLEREIQTIHQHRREAGRAGADFEVIAAMGTSREAIRRSEEVGVTTCHIDVAGETLKGTKEQYIDAIKRFADDVIADV